MNYISDVFLLELHNILKIKGKPGEGKILHPHDSCLQTTVEHRKSRENT